jgi:hypothetical protein
MVGWLEVLSVRLRLRKWDGDHDGKQLSQWQALASSCPGSMTVAGGSEATQLL